MIHNRGARHADREAQDRFAVASLILTDVTSRFPPHFSSTASLSLWRLFRSLDAGISSCLCYFNRVDVSLFSAVVKSMPLLPCKAHTHTHTHRDTEIESRRHFSCCIRTTDARHERGTREARVRATETMKEIERRSFGWGSCYASKCAKSITGIFESGNPVPATRNPARDV